VIVAVRLAASRAATTALVGLDVPTGVVGGVMLAVLAYLFKELRRKDDSVWQIIAEKDRELDFLRKQVEELRGKAADYRAERNFWRGKRIADADDGYEADMRELGRRRGRALGSGEDIDDGDATR
jgi:hypothetical protein